MILGDSGIYFKVMNLELRSALMKKLPIQRNPLRTREDLQKAVCNLCEPLGDYFSEGRAHVEIGFTGTRHDEAISTMEAFSRPLCGLVPLWVSGASSKIDDLYIEGIRNGTNPDHPEYWGRTTPRDQRFVEMAVLGLGLSLAPNRIWDPLSQVERENLVNWFKSGESLSSARK